MNIKYIYSIIVILIILFISPWYQTPHGRENILEHRTREFDTRLDENGDRTCECDGSCIIRDTHWVPFGVLINDCSHDSYFKIFWGSELHIKGE